MSTTCVTCVVPFLAKKALVSTAIGTDALCAKRAATRVYLRAGIQRQSANAGWANSSSVASVFINFRSRTAPGLMRTNAGVRDSMPSPRAQVCKTRRLYGGSCAGARSAQPAYGCRTLLQIVHTSISIRLQSLSRLNCAALSGAAESTAEASALRRGARTAWLQPTFFWYF